MAKDNSQKNIVKDNWEIFLILFALIIFFILGVGPAILTAISQPQNVEWEKVGGSFGGPLVLIILFAWGYSIGKKRLLAKKKV